MRQLHLHGRTAPGDDVTSAVRHHCDEAPGDRFQMVSAESLFFYLYDMYAAKKNMDFHFTYDEGMIRCDASLIKSVLINLLDNACKASEPGSPVDVDGYALSEGYRFSVKDYGVRDSGGGSLQDNEGILHGG